VNEAEDGAPDRRAPPKARRIRAPRKTLSAHAGNAQSQRAGFGGTNPSLSSQALDAVEPEKFRCAIKHNGRTPR
jgi:hypothetical protein